MNKSFFVTAGALAASYTAYNITEHAIPTKSSYMVRVPKELAGLKLLLLSDLHGNPFLCNNNKLITLLAAEKPDAILVAGDMVNRYVIKQNRSIPHFLMKLTKIAPVIVSIGNHEDVIRRNYPDYFQTFYSMLTRTGIYVLDNECIELTIKGKKINFCGFTIDAKYYQCKGIRTHLDTNELRKLPDYHFENTILLAHNPDYFEEYSSLAPLVVSGHIHGGMVRLPGIGGIISPQLYFPPYTKGCYSKEDSVMVVSAGLGSHTLPIRFRNPVEYCVIRTIEQNEAVE